MTEWQVFLTISALVSFVAIVAKPIYTSAKHSATMVTELKMFNENFREYKDKSEKEHEELWKQVDKNEKDIADHEKRIYLIEHKGDD